MGVTGTILAAKATSGVDVDRVLESFDFGPPEPGGDGWFISTAHRDGDRAKDYFEDLVSALGGPAIVVRVLPDDWAYLIASAPGSEPIALVLTPDAVRAEVEPSDVQEAPAVDDHD
jgi:hypothetical protein